VRFTALLLISLAMNACTDATRTNGGEYLADNPIKFPVTPMQVDGIWTGYYSYLDSRLRPVVIAVVMSIDASGHITGDVLEPNTFGPTKSPALTSKISGAILGKDVNLTFTYDGREGVSHSVENSMKFSEDGKSLSGTWWIGKDWHGKIKITKIMDAHRESSLK